MQNICETLQVSAIKGSGYVWPGKLKRHPLPSGVKRRMQNIRMEYRQRRIPDVRHPGGMSAEQNSGCDTSGWNVGEFPYPDSLREKHTALAIITPRTIAYRIRICCPNEKDSRSAALRWCVRTSFAMDSKELSSIFDCFGDQKAIKTPKLNTIWLELIARVLNMPLS